MDNIEKQKEHFENISERYYKSRQTKNHLLLKDLIWHFFLKNKNYLKKDGLKVLEPMCGYAEGKEILEKHLGIKVLYSGFDSSKNLVEKVKKSNPDLAVYEMDVTKFIPQEKYDLVIIIGGLHHVPFNVMGVLKNIHEALNDDGYFICLEPTHNNFIFRKIRSGIYKKNSLFDENTEQAFELKKLNKYFRKSNFKIVDQIYPGLLSYIFYYNPDAFPFLNKGSEKIVRTLFSVDKLFFRNFIGKKLSFATLTLLKKNGN